MLSCEAYLGIPTRYPHWSYGKAYDKKKTLYSLNIVGLPYEMVINSNPCLAYLMKNNTLLLQILTMAHVYGHNDFFANNRMFLEGTKAENTIEKFKLDAEVIRRYINDYNIGYERVEKILDAAHSIRYQIPRTIGFKGLSKDLMTFIIENSPLENWAKNILKIVKRETEYFIPQIETKIMNEGWASFWHYNILNSLNLETKLHIEFLKRHNDVVAPVIGTINPYYVGFKIFQDIEKRYGREKIFEVRKNERDSSFLRKYLTRELCDEMNLYQYAKKSFDYIIKEVADEDGWIEIRNYLSDTCGVADIPYIEVIDFDKGNLALRLEHCFDGRELKMNYAKETLKYIKALWGNKVILKTKNKDDKEIEIVCDKEGKVYIN